MRRNIASLLLLVMLLTGVIPAFAAETPPLVYTAVDGDFEWVATTTEGYTAVNKGQGYYKYVGTQTIVNIPNKIEDTEMTNYYKMFSGNSTVKKVLSANPKVDSMTQMFSDAKMDSLDVTGLNVEAVTHANEMFDKATIKTIILDGMNFAKLSNGTKMFSSTQAEVIDLSLVDFAPTANLTDMFKDAKATKGYAKTLSLASKFNSTSGKPANLNFKVTPEVYITPNGGDTPARDYTVQVNMTSEDPIKESVYRWTTTDTFPNDGSWAVLSDGSYVTTPTGAKDDQYLHIKVTDAKGRVNTYTSRKFKLGGTIPGAPILQSTPTALTSGKVKVTINSGVAGSIIEYSVDNGPWVTGTSVELTENGVVRARIKGDAGATSAESVLSVNNIVKDKPTVLFGTDGDSSYSRSHSTRVDARAAYPADIDELSYFWGEASASKDVSWTKFKNGTVLSTPDKSGDLYLHIKVKDTSGQEIEATSKAFKTDVTPPKDPTITVKESADKLSSIVTIKEGADEHSGVNYTEYRMDSSITKWTRIKENEEISVTPLEAALIEARTIDKVGNVSNIVTASSKGDSTYIDKLYKETYTSYMKLLPYTILRNGKIDTMEGVVVKGLNTSKLGIQDITVTILGKTTKHKIEVVSLTESKVAASQIPSKHWSANAVKNVVAKGYIVGSDGGNLRLDSPLRVSETYVALNKLILAKDVWGTPVGRDIVDTVPVRNTWYYCSINSVLNRFSEDDLKKYTLGDPDRDILRDEVALIMYNSLRGRLVETKDMIDYKDLDASSYKEAITWATKVGLMQGHAGKVYPKKTLTRAELMTILNTLDSLIR